MRNNKGFTLIEAIVAIALTALIFTGLAYGTATITSLVTESTTIKNDSDTLFQTIQGSDTSALTSANSSGISLKVNGTSKTISTNSTIYSASKTLDADTDIKLSYFKSNGTYVNEDDSSSGGTTDDKNTPPLPKNIPTYYTYTIYDRLAYMSKTVSTSTNITNNKGYYTQGVSYSKGDFVYYNGYWYLKLYTANTTYAPGTSNSYWQIMELNYNPQHLSAYYDNDLISYDGKIYVNNLSKYYANGVGDNIVKDNIEPHIPGNYYSYSTSWWFISYTTSIQDFQLAGQNDKAHWISTSGNGNNYCAYPNGSKYYLFY